MTNVLPFPPVVYLAPMRTFHIDHGQGRTVAVFFRVAVNHHCHPAGTRHQPQANQHALDEVALGERRAASANFRPQEGRSWHVSAVR